MAQYTIDRACGHRETIQIYGHDRHGRRDWIAKKAAGDPCTDCADAARTSQRKAESKNAAILAAEQGLPALTGAPGRVAWAESVRAQTVKRIDKLRLQIGRRLTRNPGQVAVADLQAEALTTVLMGKTDAKWWIDHLDPAAYLEIRREAAELFKRREAMAIAARPKVGTLSDDELRSLIRGYGQEDPYLTEVFRRVPALGALYAAYMAALEADSDDYFEKHPEASVLMTFEVPASAATRRVEELYRKAMDDWMAGSPGLVDKHEAGRLIGKQPDTAARWLRRHGVFPVARSGGQRGEALYSRAEVLEEAGLPVSGVETVDATNQGSAL